MENPQSEPSMEEILASIRRIISEDDEGAPAKPEAGKPTLVQKAEKKLNAPASPSKVKPSAVAEQDTAKPHLETEDVEMIKKNVTTAAEQETPGAFLDSSSADAASQAFHALSQSVRVSDGQGQTVEDIVVGMLRPLIKEWLDANLPAIVEEKVEEEVQRVARRRA